MNELESEYVSAREEVGRMLRVLTDAFHTPLPWTVRSDEDKFYISGPPDTRVVADNMEERDAKLIVELVNSSRRWLRDSQFMYDYFAGNGEAIPEETVSDALVEWVRELLIELAQAKGSPIVVPEASTAGDLTLLHRGCSVEVGGGRVFTVKDIREDGDFVVIEQMFNESVVYLQNDIPVKVLDWFNRSVDSPGIESEPVAVDVPEDTEE